MTKRTSCWKALVAFFRGPPLKFITNAGVSSTLISGWVKWFSILYGWTAFEIITTIIYNYFYCHVERSRDFILCLLVIHMLQPLCE